MRPFSVLHLNTERGWRGGERQTFLLARELSRRGHRNVVACRPGEPLAEKCREAGLPVFAVSPWSEMALWEAARLRRFLKKNRTNIFHAHTGHALGVGALAARGSPARFVATRRVDFPVRGGLSRWKYGAPQAWGAISSMVRIRLEQAGVPSPKIHLIGSGLDSTLYPSVHDRERFRRERGLSMTEKVIVHVGALEPHKDQSLLIRAFARLAKKAPDFRLLILGQGPLRSALEDIARREGVAERVSFLGHRPDVLEYTALADLFVFSSREEGLGTALLDAFFLGVPTAATSAGGIPDLYGGPTAPELSPPGDVAALAVNMERGMIPAEAAARVTRGLGRAQRFTVGAMADAYERLYNEVLCRDCPPS